MNNKHILGTLILICTLLTACDKFKNDTNKNVQSAEVDSSTINNFPGDTLNASMEWGQPAPPPEVNGDGSSLFEERVNPPVTANAELDDDVAGYDAWSLGRKSDPLAEAAFRNSTGQPNYGYNPNTVPEKKIWKPVNTDNGMNFEFDQVQMPTKIETLPYAANDQEKTQFLNEFYKNFIQQGGKTLDDEQLSITCKRMLADMAADKGFDNIAPFFHVNPENSTASTEQTLASLKVNKASGDWFDVAMDEGDGEKTIKVRVVEVNRNLKVDAVDNKCW